LREIATWPEGREFETLQPMLRITVNAILRTVFGAEGPAFDELRVLLPAAITFGTRLIMLPPIVRLDLGPWSPGGRFLQSRRRIDAVIDSLIADARALPSKNAATCSPCCRRLVTTTVSRSRIGISPTSWSR
jgi:cytochrome P450